MRIYLVQHGKAELEEQDPARPLSGEGIQQTEDIAKRIKGRLGISVIYCSRKLRAQQTAQILAKHLGVKPQSVDGLKPLDDIQNALDLVEDNVMFVGHLPYLSKLASQLLIGDSQLEIVRFTYSGVLCLEKEGKWRLVFYELP